MKTKEIIRYTEQRNKEIFARIKNEEMSLEYKKYLIGIIKNNTDKIKYLERQVLNEDLEKSYRNMILFFCLTGLAHIVSLFYYVLFK